MHRAGWSVLNLGKARFPFDWLRVPLDPAGGNDLHAVRHAIEQSVSMMRHGRPVFVACPDGLIRAPAITAGIFAQAGISPLAAFAISEISDRSGGKIPLDNPVLRDVEKVAWQRAVYINCDLHGFGDATYCAWIAQGSRQAPVTLVCRATGKKREYLEMLGQYVSDRDPILCVDTFDAYFSWELELERGQVPRVLSRARALGIVHSPPARPGPVTISQAAREWAATIAAQQRAHGKKKFIALWPNTDWKSREWPEAHWCDLAWKLWFDGYGAAFFCGSRDKRFIEATPASFYGFGWDNWAAIMEAADLNICISSGPACLAGTLDVPCLVLEGPTKPTIWAHNPSIEVMRVSKDELDCVGCHFGAPFRRACDHNCQALMRVWPEQVFQRVKEKLKELEHDPANAKYSGRDPVTVFDPAGHFGEPGSQGDRGGLEGRLLSDPFVAVAGPG